MLAMLLLAFLISADALVEGPCGLPRANEPALRSIAAATNRAQLQSARSRWASDDPIARLFVASRIAELSPGVDSDDALIDALPNREDTVTLMYSFTLGCSAPESIVLFGGGSWIQQARDAVIRQRRGVRAFLMLTWLYRGNADVGESLPDSIEAVRLALPAEYSRALKSLPAEVRAMVIGGRELLPSQ